MESVNTTISNLVYEKTIREIEHKIINNPELELMFGPNHYEKLIGSTNETLSRLGLISYNIKLD